MFYLQISSSKTFIRTDKIEFHLSETKWSFQKKIVSKRNKEEKRRKKNENSRRSYNKLHKSAKEKVYSESCEAKRKRTLRQETKQKIDEKKLKNKLRVKRHREKIKLSHENTAHARVLPCNSDVFRNSMEKSSDLRN
jgi:hypothetical protein